MDITTIYLLIASFVFGLIFSLGISSWIDRSAAFINGVLAMIILPCDSFFVNLLISITPITAGILAALLVFILIERQCPTTTTAETPAKEPRKCEYCGHELSRRDKNCDNCGAAVSADNKKVS